MIRKFNIKDIVHISENEAENPEQSKDIIQTFEDNGDNSEELKDVNQTSEDDEENTKQLKEMSFDELSLYAIEHGIDLGQTTSQNGAYKKITSHSESLNKDAES